jgi:hypothetical protein
MLLLHRYVPMLPQPLSDSFNGSAVSAFGCLLLDHPVIISGFYPVMGESQQVKAPGSCSIDPKLAGFLSWFPEVDQAGLLWMKGQAVFTKSLRQDGHHLPCVLFLLKAHERIVGKADQKRPVVEPGHYLFVEPDVQDLMKVDVGNQRRDNPKAK